MGSHPLVFGEQDVYSSVVEAGVKEVAVQVTQFPCYLTVQSATWQEKVVLVLGNGIIVEVEVVSK